MPLIGCMSLTTISEIEGVVVAAIRDDGPSLLLRGNSATVSIDVGCIKGTECFALSKISFIKPISTID